MKRKSNNYKTYIFIITVLAITSLFTIPLMNSNNDDYLPPTVENNIPKTALIETIALKPDGDVEYQWNDGAGTPHYLHVDDDPDNPDEHFVSESQDSNLYERYDFESVDIGLGTITQIRVRIRFFFASAGTPQVALYFGGAEPVWKNLISDFPNAQDYIWPGLDGDQTDLIGLQVRFKSSLGTGMVRFNVLQAVEVYATYEPSDVVSGICRPSGDVVNQWLPFLDDHYDRLNEEVTNPALGNNIAITASYLENHKYERFNMSNNIKLVKTVSKIEVHTYGMSIGTKNPEVCIWWNDGWTQWQTVDVPRRSTLGPLPSGWTINTFNLESNPGDQFDVDELKIQYKSHCNGFLYIPFGGMMPIGSNTIDTFYAEVTYEEGIHIMSPRANEDYTEYVALDISPNTLTQVEYKLDNDDWESISGDRALHIPQGEGHTIQVSGYSGATKYYSDIVSFNTWDVSTSGEQGLDWGADLINAEKCWGTTKGNNIKVLVIDSGMDLDHTDLVENYVKGKDWVPSIPDDEPEDEGGHGTMCAGILGAMDNEIGVIGVAPEVSLYIARTDTSDDVYDAVWWGVTEGVDVISMSFFSHEDLFEYSSAVQLAYNNGITVVACAGNWDDNPATPEPYIKTIGYPAAYYDYVIPVGALYYDLTLAGLTQNTGWIPNPAHPELYAGSCWGYDEGHGVVAAGTQITTSALNNGYYTGNGTSFATPLVAGVCALILAASSNIYQMTGSTRVNAVRECIYNTALDLGGTGWDLYYGNGMVDAERTIDYALANF